MHWYQNKTTFGSVVSWDHCPNEKVLANLNFNSKTPELEPLNIIFNFKSKR